MARLEVGVVSDTHGLVRAEAVEALAGVDVLLHAGDIGDNQVLKELQTLAPVFAVRGNVDGGWARLLPERRLLDLGGAGVLLLHDRALVGSRPFETEVRATKAAARVGRAGGGGPAGDRVIVFGHSHQPFAESRDGILWFNPGSCGPRRFKLPVSIGRLSIEDGRVRHRLVTLDVRGGLSGPTM
jgi:putative phosphoesterase